MKEGGEIMFHFTLVPFEFTNHADMGGPLVQANLQAKWLTEWCPPDLVIAFAPVKNDVPFHHSLKTKLVSSHEPADWKHYFNDNIWPGSDPGRCSFGPSLVLEKTGRLDTIAQHRIPLVTISEYSKSQVLDGWDYDPRMIHVMPNMIDPMFKPGEKAQQFTVGWIGYDHPDRWVKGAEVIPYLAQQFPDIQFEMVFATMPRYQHEWMPQPLPNVRIYTQVLHTQMPSIVQRWHVLASGSKHETGGAHIAEAMACGVPVICAGVGALPDTARGQVILENTQRWYKYPHEWTPATLKMYAEALQQLLRDKTWYASKVQAALTRSADFHPRNIADLWFQFMYQCRDAM
jgi:glycosyltransferase involved in cell wall biosynthesis